MSQKKAKSNNAEIPKNVYFLSLELENIRCFGEKQKIDFSDGTEKHQQWTIILGNNGTGKTTVLQGLVATIPTSIYTDLEDMPSKKAILPNIWEFEIEEGIRKRKNPLVKGNNNSSEESTILSKKDKSLNFVLEVNIVVQNFVGKILRVVELKIHDNGYQTNIGDENFLEVKQNCFAYGASRKVGQISISEQKESSTYKTLFDENALLLNPEEWLLQTDYAAKRKSKFSGKRKKEYEIVKKILIDILPDVDDIRVVENESKRIPFPIVQFHTPYGWVEAKDLSLGYRTSMAWMVDFASRMFDLYPESENPLAEPAVVLIDEIDLHLHPKWQRDLLPWLSELFPNTQFIVTTHSPLIVQSAVARDANIVVCRREGDHVVIDQSVEAVKNWRADQILTSDLFGLETARPKETGNLLKEKQKILSKAKLTKKDEKRLAELDQEIGFLPVSENPEDDEAMEIIRKAADWIKTQAK